MIVSLCNAKYTDFLTDEFVSPLSEALACIPVTLYDNAGGSAMWPLTACVKSPAKGVNIVVYSDGSAKKEVG